MKYLWILNLIIISLSMSCSKNGTEFSVDPELLPLYEDFIASGKMRGVDVSTDNLVIEFGNAKVRSDNAIAYCGRSIKNVGDPILGGETKINSPKIVVDRELFLSMDKYSQRAVMFHELGHCLLQREHTLELNEFRYIKSIMYPNLLTRVLGPLYPLVENNYIDELFDPSTLGTDPFTIDMSQTSGKIYSSGADGSCGEDSVSEEELSEIANQHKLQRKENINE